MIDKIKIAFGISNRIGIIGIHNNKDSQEYFYAILTKEKNELIVTEFNKNINNLDEISTINENMPLIMVFTGTGIVYSKGGNDLILNSNPEDYYITKYSTEKETFTAFSRKDKIDTFLTYFNTKKYFIVDVVIGVLSTNLLYKKVFDKKSLQITDLILEYDTTDCIEFTKTQYDTDNIILIENNEEKNTLELLLFSVGLNYYFPSKKLTNNYSNDLIQKNKIDFKYKKQFDLITKIGFLLFVFTLCLIFFIKGYTTYKINKITDLVSNTSKYQNEYSFLSNEKKRKLEVIKISGLLNSNFLSFYINEIGSLIPNNIVLQEMNVLPVTHPINSDKQLQIDNRKLLLIGKTSNNNAFNTLLEKLNSKKWVNKIEIINYNQKRNNNSYFKLEIILK